MFIPDLQESASAYHPQWIERGGKLGSGFLPVDTVVRAVGWLGTQVLSSGDTPEECIDRLLLAYERKLVFRQGGLGWHDCEVCSEDSQRYPGGEIGPVVHWRGRDVRLYGHGHYLVKSGNVVYRCPALILHYIVDHRYRPPDEFVKAVVGGSFVTADDLVFVPDAS